MRPAVVVLRVGVAVGGGYVFTGMAVLVLGRLLAQAGLSASQAVVAAGMAGFLIYLLVLIWALVCASVARLCWLTAAACAALAGLYGVLR